MIQRSGFLCATEGVELTVGFQKKLARASSAAKGFLLQKLGGSCASVGRAGRRGARMRRPPARRGAPREPRPRRDVPGADGLRRADGAGDHEQAVRGRGAVLAHRSPGPGRVLAADAADREPCSRSASRTCRSRRQTASSVATSKSAGTDRQDLAAAPRTSRRGRRGSRRRSRCPSTGGDVVLAYVDRPAPARPGAPRTVVDVEEPRHDRVHVDVVARLFWRWW